MRARYVDYPVDENSSFGDFQGTLFAKRALAKYGALEKGHEIDNAIKCYKRMMQVSWLVHD